MNYIYFKQNKEKLIEALEKAIYTTLVNMKEDINGIDWFSVTAKRSDKIENTS